MDAVQQQIKCGKFNVDKETLLTVNNLLEKMVTELHDLLQILETKASLHDGHFYPVVEIRKLNSENTQCNSLRSRALNVYELPDVCAEQINCGDIQNIYLPTGIESNTNSSSLSPDQENTESQMNFVKIQDKDAGCLERKNGNDILAVCQKDIDRELSSINKNKSMCSFKCISNVVTNTSSICSLMGIILFGGIFFGFADTLDYGSMCLIYECAQYLTIGAVLLFLLGAVISWFSMEDSKRANSETHLKGRALVDRVISNISSKVSKQTAKEIKSDKYDKKIKRDTATENTKLKHTGIFKRDKVVAKTSPLSMSSKNMTLIEKSKHDDGGTKALPLPISSKTKQNAAMSQEAEISSKTLSSNTLFKSVKSGTASQKAESSARSPSKNISSTKTHTTVTPKTKVTPKTAQHSNEKFSCSDKQLVPYKARLEYPIPENKMSVVQKIPFYSNSMSKQYEINSSSSTSNISSNALKLDNRHQKADFSGKTSSRSSRTVLQPIGPPKQRKVCPGTFNPKPTQSSVKKDSYADKVVPNDPWTFISTTEDNNFPYNQNFMMKSESGYTPAAENFPSADSQLFPYNPQLFGSPVREQNIPAGPTVPFYPHLMPSYASRYTPATEVFATKKVTFFEGGIAQSYEEHHRTMFFPHLGNGIWSPNLDCPSDQRVPNEKVSDMQTKFESMNMQ